ncbi:type II secretion system F family protein [Paenarthrobacter nitroguajacolicus]|uniref:type II secretion system F family protein n=1 Tax=Paenarthrobacter nitroguajacolicus TaxID=211146 RepID=UPI0040547039
MIGAFVLIAALAAWLHFTGPRFGSRRLRTSLGIPTIRWGSTNARVGLRPGNSRRRQRIEPLPLVVLVQQLAALLRGGRGTSKLWDELWIVHNSRQITGGGTSPAQAPEVEKRNAGLSRESLHVLAAARSASTVGNSPAEAIRGMATKAYPRRGSSERRVWMELAACLDIAETSGCPLADLLTRFAAQLEAEEDAEAARQTALAGPKATVRLLSWLPVFGLGLGMALGVDPLGILLNNFLGVATFASGLLLTAAGRVWSSRLVASAAGGP